MRKRKKNNLDLSLEINENQGLSAPAPGYGMTIKGTDMYWYPETTVLDKKRDIIAELLTVNPQDI